MRLKNGKTEFWQWDLHQILVIDNFPANTAVHFSHPDSEIAFVTKTNADFETVVPDVLLQQPKDINVYICPTDDKTTYTKRSYSISVRPRPRPDDYVYTPEEIKLWAEKLNKNLGEENAGKLLSVSENGDVVTIKDNSGVAPPESLDNTELESLIRNFS